MHRKTDMGGGPRLQTEIVKVDHELSLDELMLNYNLIKGASLIKKGDVVAIPTETVYGLAADALNPTAARKIYRAKGRPSDNPLIVHVADMDHVLSLAAEVPEGAMKLAEKFWPGPLTMIFPKTDIVPYETTGGLDTVAVRMPKHNVALAMIKLSGGFLAAPSANASGKPSPTEARHVQEDLNGRIPMIIDSGSVGIGLESTIIDFSAGAPTILRPGYITKAMAEEVIGEISVDGALIAVDSRNKPKAPGMKYRHYAPRAPLTVVMGESKAVVERINSIADTASKSGKKVGVICSEETLLGYYADEIIPLGSKGDEITVAKNLFGVFRKMDERGVDVIYSEAFESDGLGVAIMNRLLKAAGSNVIRLRKD